MQDVELSLLSLTDIVEMQLLQENQLESRFRLAMHREKKLADLNNVKGIVLYTFVFMKILFIYWQS